MGPVSATPDDKCHVRWCDEGNDHDGLHRHYLAEVILDFPHAGSIALTIESSSAVPYPTLTVSKQDDDHLAAATMRWEQFDQLARAMRDAHQRYANRGSHERRADRLIGHPEDLTVVRPPWPGPCPCPCECNSGGFCGGCGHAGCGGRRHG